MAVGINRADEINEKGVELMVLFKDVFQPVKGIGNIITAASGEEVFLLGALITGFAVFTADMIIMEVELLALALRTYQDCRIDS